MSKIDWQKLNDKELKIEFVNGKEIWITKKDLAELSDEEYYNFCFKCLNKIRRAQIGEFVSLDWVSDGKIKDTMVFNTNEIQHVGFSRYGVDEADSCKSNNDILEANVLLKSLKILTMQEEMFKDMAKTQKDKPTKRKVLKE